MAFRVARAFFWLAAPSWSCAPAGCSKVTMSKKLTSCNDTLRGRNSIQPLLLIDCTNGDGFEKKPRISPTLPTFEKHSQERSAELQIPPPKRQRDAVRAASS